MSEANDYEQYIIPRNRRLDLTDFLFLPEYRRTELNYSLESLGHSTLTQSSFMLQKQLENKDSGRQW